jgi:single-strand DNA-binding protein
MSGTVNKVILIGNLGKDPEVRHLENGATVANFSIATSESYTDRNSGEKRETTDWHDIVLWGGLAEIAEKYLKKGTKIYLEGRLKKRSWQDKEGQTRYTAEVLAEELTILSRPEISERPSNEPNYSNKGIPNPPNTLKDFKDAENDYSPF